MSKLCKLPFQKPLRASRLIDLYQGEGRPHIKGMEGNGTVAWVGGGSVQRTIDLPGCNLVLALRARVSPDQDRVSHTPNKSHLVSRGLALQETI